MRFFPFSASASIIAAGILFIVVNHAIVMSDAVTIEIGSNPSPGIGWIEGVCYAPIIDARVGDELEFDLTAHNVFKLPSKWEFETCEFNAATLLAEAASGKFIYTITEEDARQGDVYLACGVGSHCLANQKIKIVITSDGNDLVERPTPKSTYVLGLSSKDCLKLQYSTNEVSSGGGSDSIDADSDCTDPVMLDDGGYHVSCLSPPATLTPGGVIWDARIMHYPFPKDRRVRNGLRVWEFVEGDPEEDGFSGLTPSALNRLYIHHLSGAVVFGQGSEGSRRNNTDTEFPKPYGQVTGDEGDLMIFHVIDLRDVDEWLECIECRCKDTDGTYLDLGGVNCCSNCTTTAPEPETIDYRMRYNVTYYEIEEDKPVEQVIWLTADQSPSLGKNIEYDVPLFDSIPQEQQLVSSDGQKMQRLERVGPFNEIFQQGYFQNDYDGPETVKILRCVGHLHVGGVAMYLEDTVTGKTICAETARYGTDLNKNEGLLIGVDVNNYEEPIEIPSDRVVRLITDYDASELHTGVMAITFLFIATGEEITRDMTPLTVDMCLQEACDSSVLPSFDAMKKPQDSTDVCIDELADHPMCKFGGLCICEDVINSPESTGCNGVYTSTFGDIPINSVCNASCGCPTLPDEIPIQAVTTSKSTCLDTLVEFPACKFGGICDCEEFVNAPTSTGCGGVYNSTWGEVENNDVCAAYCDACPDEILTNEETVDMTDPIIEMIESQLSNACQFATDDCKFLLSNLYTCADIADDTEVDPVMIVVRDYGQQIALEYAKLGEPILHVGEEDQEVASCGKGAIICEDTLPSNPACLFGSLCECEEFVNAPESTGCGGVYASDFGDIQVNEVCAAYCDACPDENTGNAYVPGADMDDSSITESMRTGCENRLSKSPACRFGKLCDCEDFATDPMSSGCGGVYTSRFGDTSVDEMCPSYCGVCHLQASSPRMHSLLLATALLFISTLMQL